MIATLLALLLAACIIGCAWWTVWDERRQAATDRLERQLRASRFRRTEVVCPTCKGRSTVTDTTGQFTKYCDTCGGTGLVWATPPAQDDTVARAAAVIRDDAYVGERFARQAAHRLAAAGLLATGPAPETDFATTLVRDQLTYRLIEAAIVWHRAAIDSLFDDINALDAAVGAYLAVHPEVQ